jgi:hypothetical protein
LKSEIASFEDVIIGRLDKIDEELAIINGYKDQLEDHEDRITRLEKKPVTI